MGWFGVATLVGWALVVVAARVVRVVRSGTFAAFVGVLVGIHALCAVALAPAFREVLPLFAALHAAVFVNYLTLARPRMRSLPFRLLVSWPAAFFAGGTLLALPWAVLLALGFHPVAPWLPYLLAGIGLFQSLTLRREEIDLVVGPGSEHVPVLAPHRRGDARDERPLRIVQITDPHLGPFMSVARLRRICERALAKKPDVVLLTGDFLTMESQSDPDLLRDALAPLRALPGKVFACHGNHDHEAPEIVRRAMRENGITLLVDDAREIDTPSGRVQILGVDFAWKGREEHLDRVCRAFPRREDALRVVLLHDPGAFKHLPHGHGDLVLSGHTHGGQVGLVSLGLAWTFLRLFGLKLPDHGFWARGTDRMYVHRGTGHYGFPLRLGVPAEESLLRVHRSIPAGG
jgi:uncharacterized protein